MKDAYKFAAAHWPAALVVVVVLCDGRWPPIVASLVLLFRREATAALRRRRITVEAAGFKATLGDDTSMPEGGGK